jgi:hypothetical protein
MQVMSVPGTRSLRSSAAPLPVAPAGLPASAAAAVVSATPAPVTGEIAPLARPEARVPGAAFTLPANPLSDLDAADLAGFIELTLLETNGAAGAAPLAGGEALGSDAPVLVAAEPAHVAPPPPPARRQETRLERAQRIGRRVAPYAACVLVGLWLGMTFRPNAKVAVMVGAPAVVTPPEGEPMPAAAPPAEATATPSARDCVARVTTTPKGAQVLWGDIALGTSPLAHAAIPCGAGTLTFRRERYAELTRKISADRGQDTVVDERMTRPPAKLLVTSSPPNALIKVNKSRFGQAPRKINTQRYEHLHLQASLPGYRPWKKTVYLKDAETKVDVELVPIAKPNARRAAAPAAASTRAAAPPAIPARAATPPAAVAKGAPLKPSAR